MHLFPASQYPYNPSYCINSSGSRRAAIGHIQSDSHDALTLPPCEFCPSALAVDVESPPPPPLAVGVSWCWLTAGEYSAPSLWALTLDRLSLESGWWSNCQCRTVGFDIEMCFSRGLFALSLDCTARMQSPVLTRNECDRGTNVR